MEGVGAGDRPRVLGFLDDRTAILADARGGFTEQRRGRGLAGKRAGAINHDFAGFIDDRRDLEPGKLGHELHIGEEGLALARADETFAEPGE